MTATWPPAGAPAVATNTGPRKRYGFTIEVADVGDHYVGLLDGDEVLTRPNRLDAMTATEALAKRRWKAAHPTTSTGAVPMLDPEPYRALLKGE